MPNYQRNTNPNTFSHETTSLLPASDASDSGWYDLEHDRFFHRYLILTITTTTLPWLFFAVVWRSEGIVLPRTAANIAQKHPQEVTFFMTSAGDVFKLGVSWLFSEAVVSLAKKWIAYKDAAIFHISFFASLNSGDAFLLFHQRKLNLFYTVLLKISIFALVGSGITTLLTPAPFIRRVTLTGSELDFASIDNTCIKWFNNNTVPHICDWQASLESLIHLPLTPPHLC